jgi:RNA polymerase sigma factor (sigma-70 family)
MGMGVTPPILHEIRRIVEDERTRQRSDRDLLAEFVGRRDQTAYQALVRRHGPMVLDVCRCLLANEADAEDAFQATFLILARKAGSVRKAGSLGSWLHGVAYRTALKARAGFTKRRKHETQAVAREPAAGNDPANDEPGWREIQRVLHEELAGLGERQRAALVLCYLQGKTQEEAATLLGVAKSTLRTRLEQGRATLRARLVRRGLGPAAVLLASAWPGAASAELPGHLAGAAVRAATLTAAGQPLAGVVSAKIAALAEGGWTAMVTKAKATALGLILVVALGVGFRALGFPTSGGEQLSAGVNARADNGPRPNAKQPQEAEPAKLNVFVAGVCRKAEDNSPVADADVQFHVYRRNPSRMELWKNTRTDRDGRFTIKGDLAADRTDDARRCRICVRSPGCATRLFFWQPDAKYDPPVELTLQAPTKLDGRVVNPDGKPVSGAFVYTGIPYIKGVNDAVTDMDGHFVIDDLDAEELSAALKAFGADGLQITGRYVHASHPGFLKGRAVYTKLPASVEIRLSKKAPEQIGEGSNPLFRVGDSAQPLPEDLRARYTKLIRAFRARDEGRIRELSLPGSVMIRGGFPYNGYGSEERVARGEVNPQFAQDVGLLGFAADVVTVTKHSEDVYLLRTSTSGLSFVRTGSSGWKLYAYFDRPLKYDKEIK